jgi:DNA-binding protein YbaB
MPEGNSGGFASLGADPEAAERRINEWAKGFQEKAERYQAVKEQTQQLRLTASSPDGRVRVTVGADGAVTDLELTDKVRSMAPAEISAQIMSTMRQAQADIANKVGETMAATLGDEDAQTRSVVLDNLRERFPEPEEEPEVEHSSKWDFDDTAETATEPSPDAPPPASNPPAPKRRPAFEDEDDEDFGPDFDPLRD